LFIKNGGVAGMNSVNKTPAMEDMKVKFQTLWIFAMFNYLYADVLGLHDPSVLKEIITGQVGTLEISQGFLLGAAILMETAIAMVLFSRILKYGPNRWANMIVGVIHTLAVLSSMFVGTPSLYYMFFGTIEIVCTSLIVWYAWNWMPQTV
jgi:hypothetical protein